MKLTIWGVVAVTLLTGCGGGTTSAEITPDRELAPASAAVSPSAESATATTTTAAPPAGPKTYRAAVDVAEDLAAGGMAVCNEWVDSNLGFFDELQSGNCGKGVFVYLFLDSAAVNEYVDSAKAKGINHYAAIGPNWAVTTTVPADAQKAAEILAGIYSETRA